jgi:hypothetical protein
VQFHPQENSVVNFIITVNAMHISINIMLIFHFINPLSYHLHLFFHLLDCFWFYQNLILKSPLTQWRPTRSSVKRLKRCHLNGTLIFVVTHKVYQWQELFVMHLLVHHIHTQHIFKNLVCSFCLLVSLRVLCCTKV